MIELTYVTLFSMNKFLNLVLDNQPARIHVTNIELRARHGLAIGLACILSCSCPKGTASQSDDDLLDERPHTLRPLEKASTV